MDNSATRKKRAEFVVDPQSGTVFDLEVESPLDIKAAAASVIYLIFILYCIVRLFIEVYTGKPSMLFRLFEVDPDYLKSPMFQLIAYTVIGGALGGIVNGFRSIIHWHCDKRGFGWRHIWKYAMLPFLGAALAIIVCAFIRSGIAVFGVDLALDGDATKTNEFTKQAFSAFAVGSLSGYGSHQVFKWLDVKVAGWFKTKDVVETKVPELKGKTKEDAIAALRAAKLNIGKIDFAGSFDQSKSYVVAGQKPAAGEMIPQAAMVDFILKEQ